MLTPDGQSGDNTDKIMLLAMWAKEIAKMIAEETKDNPQIADDAGLPENPALASEKQIKKLIAAGMGKPTYPVNAFTVQFYIAYWKNLYALLQTAQTSSTIIPESLALDYGDGHGDIEPRTMMAEAMSTWYGAPINAENILFTVGGAGALRVIFETFNKIYSDTPKYRVITPFPHYSLYADNQHQLHPIDVMNEPGYQLTAKALEQSILSANELAKMDNNFPKVFLFSNPSNPLGTVISENELLQIAAVLRKYPDIHIVIDEAYAELYWDDLKTPSLLQLAPDLKNRMIMLRSATKALSAAGERLAMLMAFDPQLINSLHDTNIGTIGHAPRSAQLAYAHTMKNFSDQQLIDLKDYYRPKVDYVLQRAQDMGASMPDPAYKVEGAFYVLCDFSDLLGTEIPPEAKKALGKTGKIKTSEELIYSLLFKEHVMVAPGEYFGLDDKKGFIRITCSGSHEDLQEMMDRLENCLVQARQYKTSELMKQIYGKVRRLKLKNGDYNSLGNDIICQLSSIIENNSNNSLALKLQNEVLTQLLFNLNAAINRSMLIEKNSTTHLILSFLNSTKATKQKQKAEVLKTEWKKFVDNSVTEEGSFKNYLLNLDEESKKSYKPWLLHLANLAIEPATKPVGASQSDSISEIDDSTDIEEMPSLFDEGHK